MLGQVGDFIHEADLGGEHGIGRVLGEFRRAHIHDDHAVTIAGKRFVQGAHEVGGTRTVGADDHPIRLHEVRQRRTLFQEFRIRHRVIFDAGAARLQRLRHGVTHLVRGTHRHRRLGDHDLVLGHVLADGARHCQHVAQIRRTVLIRRRAHRNQLELPMIDALLGVGGEQQPTRLEVAFDHGVETRLMDGDLALFEHFDFTGIDIDTDHLVARIRQTRAGHKAHVASAKDRDSHT